MVSSTLATPVLFASVAQADTQLILRNNSSEPIDVAVMYNRYLKLRGFSFAPNSPHLIGFERIPPYQSKVIINESSQGQCLERSINNVWLSVYQVNSNQEWGGNSGRGNKFTLQSNAIAAGFIQTPVGGMNRNQISPSVVSELQSGTSLLFARTPFSVNGCNAVMEFTFPW
ncbi:MAG: hypothetical protein ACOC0N_03885 [Chroococcales cyanobacterium]